MGDSDERDADWAPNGTRIVFASNRGGAWNIWSAAADGTDLRPLTSASGRNVNPRYSPDGSTILFLSDRSGKDEIWLMNTSGGAVVPVGFVPVRVSSPAWAPNGTTIVYSGCTGETCNLYTIARDGSTFSQMTTGAFTDMTPAWSPTAIVFSSNRGGSGIGIWSVQPNGTQLHQLAPTGFDPRWDTTGSLIFVRSSGDETDSSIADVFQLDPGGDSTRLTHISGFLVDGDINVDGTVNCSDLALVRASFGRRQGQAGFDARADIDVDTVVTVRDLARVSQKLPPGTTCP
jgi:Tol biopolymer transport system component